MQDRNDPVGEKEKPDPLYNARHSIRYHERREAFFDGLHRVTSAATILLAGIIFTELGSDNNGHWYIKSLSLAGAFLGTFDLVIGFSKRADAHRDLKRRFAQLEIDLMEGLDPHKGEIERRRIEVDEPPIYKALAILCREEMCTAYELQNEFKSMSFFPRITASLYRWPNIASRMQKRFDQESQAKGKPQ